MKNKAYNMLPFGAGLILKKFAYTFRNGGLHKIRLDTSIFSNLGMTARFFECNLLHKFEFRTK